MWFLGGSYSEKKTTRGCQRGGEKVGWTSLGVDIKLRKEVIDVSSEESGVHTWGKCSGSGERDSSEKERGNGEDDMTNQSWRPSKWRYRQKEKTRSVGRNRKLTRISREEENFTKKV